jgi:serine/threonine protein kinase
MCTREGRDVRVHAAYRDEDYRLLLRRFREEARLLAGLQHPNVVLVFDMFEENGTSYMVLEHLEGRDLHTVAREARRGLGPAAIHELTVALLGAVDYLHGAGVLHRDISPENILLDRQGRPFLIDFGAALQRAAGRSADPAAVLAVKDGYSPQEFYTRCQPHTATSDLYALGATVHFLITGAAPPPSQDRLAAIAAGAPDPYRPLSGRFDRFHPATLRAVDRALAPLPQQRFRGARDWLLEIDEESRRRDAADAARKSARIEDLVGRLVAETNAEIAAAGRSGSEARGGASAAAAVAAGTSSGTSPALAPAPAPGTGPETGPQDGPETGPGSEPETVAGNVIRLAERVPRFARPEGRLAALFGYGRPARRDGALSARQG